MDCFDDIQIEEIENFDFVERDLTELIEEENDFNMKDYLNSNIDYWLWHLGKCPLISTFSLKLMYSY